MKTNSKWYEVANASEVTSPGLLVYPDRVRENIRRMIAIAGGVGRLRPHMKTHKLAEVIRLQVEQGITKFKCATIAEAEVTAGAGAEDVLMAYQPVGPNVPRVVQLVKSFRKTKFSVIADDAAVIRDLSRSLVEAKESIDVLLDLNVGMHRTGVMPYLEAFELYKLTGSLAGVRAGGLHAYDGHVHDSDVTARTKSCEEAFAPVAKLRERLVEKGLPVPRIVAGGTPTFPMHAQRGDVECSPGTCVFWDSGYATKYPDLDFLPAAVLLTRVVSQVELNRLCLDLGHKAVASEMPHPRVVFLNLPEAKPVAHNEEHLVVETDRALEFPVGACIYGIPWHICPTVALHSEVVVVEDGRATQRWRVAARERKLTI